MIPIWKDTFYTLPTNGEIDSFSYSIRMLDGKVIVNGVEMDNIVTIFNGKAWAKPKAESIEININQIARDYLKSNMIDLRNVTTNTSVNHDSAIRRFYIYNNSGVQLEQYDFVLDYSYVSSTYTQPYVMSRPINGKAVPNMFTFLTRLANNKVSTAIQLAVNNTTGLYTNDGNCNSQYALYYLNRYGGWDSFLIEGNGIKKDAYTKYYIDKAYNNTTLEFGKKTYHNEIVTSYELHTGWLKDSESNNLAFNLLSSNMVYLHNLSNDEIVPVVITDADSIYKTYKNQGNKLYNYTINVECSQKQHNL